jgi:peptidoglycan/LPS O-acetylase OafA/YrhL
MSPEDGRANFSGARGRLTIAQSGVLARGGNCLGLLRLILAAMVVVDHTFVLGGLGTVPIYELSHHTTTLGSIAVWAFFGLSGVLVGMSAETTGTAKYFWHRARRILPAFWVCLVVSAFGFGALLARLQHLPTSSITQPANNSARTFIVNNIGLGIHQNQVGTVLNQLPFPQAINGSLWSLAYEATCYMIVFAFVRAWITSGRRDLVIVSAFTVSVFLAFTANVGASSAIDIPLIGPLDPGMLSRLWAVFLAGTALALWRDRIPLNLTLTVIASAVCVISVPLGWFVPAGSLAMPYALLGISYYLPKRLRSVGARNDLSYGLYLYGFPVGQALVAARPTLWHAWSLMLVTLVATLGVAAVSWFAVERRFLRPPRSRAAPGEHTDAIVNADPASQRVLVPDRAQIQPRSTPRIDVGAASGHPGDRA